MKANVTRALAAVLLFCAEILSLPASPSILIIGDSNIQNGYITSGLQKILEQIYGFTGGGYCPFNAVDGPTSLEVPYFGFKPFTFKAKIGSSFSQNDIYDGERNYTPPYPSPNGLWISGNKVGDSVTVRFVGGSVDVYWLSDGNGGSFDIYADAILKKREVTQGARMAKKTKITGLNPDFSVPHTLSLRVVSGNVTLLGYDVIPSTDGTSKRAVVHNWGNSWCTALDFVNIDSTVFATSLVSLNPDVVVTLLGQNDNYNEDRSAVDFTNDMVRLLSRIQVGLPSSSILMVSSHCRVADYLTAYRQVATRTGVKYWDLYTWFQPRAAGNTMDAGHVNASGGALVAAELWNQLNSQFATSVFRENARFHRTQPSPRCVALRDHVRVTVPGAQGFEVRVMDISGRLVMDRCGRVGETDLRIPTTALPSSMLLVRVSVANGGAATFRLSSVR